VHIYVGRVSAPDDAEFVRKNVGKAFRITFQGDTEYIDIVILNDEGGFKGGGIIPCAKPRDKEL